MIFNQVIVDLSTVNDNTLLRTTMKAMNGRIGKNGLVPSRLFFSIVPSLPLFASGLPKQKELMEVIARAQMGTQAIVPESRVATPLSKKILQYADHVYHIGDRAFVYSENHDKWPGPFIVNYVDGRMIAVRTMDGTHKCLFNSFHLKPYFDVNWEDGNSRNGSSNSPERYDTCITEVTTKGDPRKKILNRETSRTASTY